MVLQVNWQNLYLYFGGVCYMRKRSEGFWGIHSDFHATPDFGVQGRALKEEDIRLVCRVLKPDYWQIDSKGHPGYASYPTELGNAMPEFALDTFEIWRRATAAEDVALIAHYSGVFDQKYCAEHPEDAILQADGNSSVNFTRLTSDYVHKVVIPQLSELAGKYGFNGAWVDGECWAVDFDYHPETVAAFERETGISLNGKLPKCKDDLYYNEYREFLRVLFRRYLKTYVDAIHSRFPDFELTSNWIYSDHAPEKPVIDVYFLSGDYAPWNCVNWARYSGRALAQQNKPWDLMVWGMRSGSAEKADLIYVHTSQLLQNAATTISLGGGFQVDVHQFPDGSPRMAQLMPLVPVAEFMRAREPFCHKGKLLHQCAMLLSTYDCHLSGIPFSCDNAQQRMGLTALLCDAGQSLEVVSEHNFEGNYSLYPMIVVPELVNGLADETVKDLLDYAFNGGSLLLAGVNTCRIFEKAGAPFTVANPAEEAVDRPVVDCVRTHKAELQRYFTLDGVYFGGVMGPVEIHSENCENVAQLCFNERCERRPFAVIIPWGKGKIAAVGANLGREYVKCAQYLHRDLIKKIADKLYTPKARIESALGNVEITCLTVGDKLTIQLTNVNGNHANDSVATENMIPPALDIKVSVALDSAQHRLTLQPEGRDIPFVFEQGRGYFELPRLDIHSVVVID